VVLKAIPEIEAAEVFWVHFMKSLKSWPRKTSQVDKLVRHVFLNCPLTVGKVFTNTFQKLCKERCISFVKLKLFASRLHVPEMHVVAKISGFIWWESLESLVPSDFMHRGHLDRTNWNQLAIILDCVDNVGKSVKLCQVLWRYFDFFFFGNIAKI